MFSDITACKFENRTLTKYPILLSTAAPVYQAYSRSFLASNLDLWCGCKDFRRSGKFILKSILIGRSILVVPSVPFAGTTGTASFAGSILTASQETESTLLFLVCSARVPQQPFSWSL
uniref:(northern house mosquito) hypothetical protein n=1 Tax=Culex pipiens TaxID=7175 RepID=A0A8D8ASF5_CULPI